MDKQDDRIVTITRVVAALVVPFLWLAFLILFFYPSTTGERFAWTIKPELTERVANAARVVREASHAFGAGRTELATR